MNCHDAHQQLNEYLDGELPGSVRSRIELHLQDCASCRERLAELQHVDHLFRSMTADGFPPPPDLVHRALAELPPTGLQQSAPPSTPSGHPGTSAPSEPTGVLILPTSRLSEESRAHSRSVKFVAFAAMITMLILFTSISRQSPWFNDSNSGRIEVAAGQVLVGPEGSEEWFLAVSTEQPLKTGMRLRTSDDGRCQIRIGKDTVVRVDANSDVIFLDENHIELLRGRVFCRAKSEEVRISLPDPQLSVRRATEVRCPEQTELQCDAFPGIFNCQLAGEFEPESLLWQLPLLGSSLGEQEEVRILVESGLARLGETKASYASEALIRSFGEQGSIPLLAYVQSEESLRKPEIRRRAMRIATDLATVRQLPDLRRLAQDPDLEIADLAGQSVLQLESGIY